MTIAILKAWILGLMLTLTPDVAYADTFEATALYIATESCDNPIHGVGTEAETAAFLTAFGYTESRFDPAALGDCKPGEPKSVEACQSIGLYQVSKAHASPNELLQPDKATRRARQLLAQSVQICRRVSPKNRFAWYAKGGVGCSPTGFRASAYHYALAQSLLRSAPLPETGEP